MNKIVLLKMPHPSKKSLKAIQAFKLGTITINEGPGLVSIQPDGTKYHLLLHDDTWFIVKQTKKGGHVVQLHPCFFPAVEEIVDKFTKLDNLLPEKLQIEDGILEL